MEAPRTAGTKGWFTAPYLPLLALVQAVAAGAWFLGAHAPTVEEEAFRATAEELRSRCDHRADHVDAWAREVIADARTVAGFPSVVRSVANPPGEVDSQIADILDDYCAHHELLAATALDREGRVRTSSRKGGEPGEPCREAARRALASGAVVVDAHHHGSGTPVVAIAVPIAPGDGNASTGATLLELDAAAHLLHILQPWNFGAQESLRVHLLGTGPGGPRPAVPAVAASGPSPGGAPWPRLPGAEGGAGGAVERLRDDRGVEVLAAVRQLESAPWRVVVTVDVAEVKAIAARGTRNDGIALAGIVLALGSGLVAAHRIREATRRRERDLLARRTTLLLDQTLDALLIATPDGRILEGNRGAAEFYGRAGPDLAGARILDLLPGEDRPAAAGRPLLAAEEEGRIEEAVHLGAGGRRVPVEVATRRVRSEGEEFLVLAVRDLSARRAAEADLVAIRDRIRLLSTALDQAPVSVVITDPAGSIQYVNPQFTRVTGYSSDEVLGRNPRVLKSGAHPPEFYAELWRTLAAGGTWRGEMQNRRKDGTLFWESVSISPVLVGERRVGHFVAVKEDVSARKRLEQEFLQAQKMESVGRLAGGVAHDFNNLLTVIGGFTELALVRTPVEDPRRPHLEQVAQASAKAAALTRHLLAFSRKQILQPRVMQVNDALGGSEKILRRLMGETVRIVLDLDRDLPAILADPGQVDQAVMNLCVNARDAMPDGGTITIATRRAVLDATAAAARGVPAGTYAVLEVSDTGTGIPEEVRAWIFEPFFTTKEAGKGTGLGLAMVQGFATQSGGAIEVDSAPGKGATFRLLLPVAPEGAGEPRAREEIPAALRGRESILVLDDEPAVAEIVRQSLERAGYEVRVAASTDEAFLLAEDPAFRIDLLVVDVVMPGMDGRRVATRITELRPGLRTLFISGYSEDIISRHGVLEEGVHLLFKPFHPSAICSRVRAVLDGAAPAPPA